MKKNIFKTILESTWTLKLIGRKGILKLARNVLEITLETSGTMGHYTKFVGRVVNARDGEISRNTFAFNDHLLQSDRIDSRPDYKGDFYIWEHDGELDWYIARPDADAAMDLVFEIIKWAQIYEPNTRKKTKDWRKYE